MQVNAYTCGEREFEEKIRIEPSVFYQHPETVILKITIPAGPPLDELHLPVDPSVIASFFLYLHIRMSGANHFLMVTAILSSSIGASWSGILTISLSWPMSLLYCLTVCNKLPNFSLNSWHTQMAGLILKERIQVLLSRTISLQPLFLKEG